MDYKLTIARNMTLTKEQYEKLQPWEKQIKAAYKSSFVRMTSADFGKVAELYKEITGIALKPSQLNCNTCRLNTLRKLGELYTKYEEEKAEKKVKKERAKKLEGKNAE